MHAQARLALDDRADGAVLELDDLGDLGQRADRVELGGVGDVLLLGLALGDECDWSAIGDRGIERCDALVATHLQRDDHLREDDRFPECDERELAHGISRDLDLDRGGRSVGHQVLLSGFGSEASASSTSSSASCTPGSGSVVRERARLLEPFPVPSA